MKTLLALPLILSLLAQDPQPDAKKEFEAKKEAVKGGNSDAHSRLGEWCLEKGLKDEAKWCYQKSFELDNTNSDAIDGMKRLGFDLDGKSFKRATELAEKRKSKLKKEDCDGRYVIAEYLKDFGYEKEAGKLLDEILKIDADHADTRKLLGFTRYYSDWLTDKELSVELKLDESWQFAVDLKKPAEEIHPDLKAAGYKGSLEEVKRILKFVGQPTGLQKNIKLEMAPGDLSKCLYTYGVPESYKPWRRNPLVVFIHGTQNGDGDGAEGFDRIWPRTGPRGYLTICPTVPDRNMYGWNSERAEKFLRALIREFSMKYNVDADRTYLIGHGMGGYGTYYCGSRMTDVFATVSAWAGGSQDAIMSNFRYTPVYIIHNKRDKELPVSFSEQADQELTKLGYYHVFVSPDLDVNSISVQDQEALLDWMERHKRNPRARK